MLCYWDKHLHKKKNSNKTFILLESQAPLSSTRCWRCLYRGVALLTSTECLQQTALKRSSLRAFRCERGTISPRRHSSSTQLNGLIPRFKSSMQLVCESHRLLYSWIARTTGSKGPRRWKPTSSRRRIERESMTELLDLQILVYEEKNTLPLLQ